MHGPNRRNSSQNTESTFQLCTLPRAEIFDSTRTKIDDLPAVHLSCQIYILVGEPDHFLKTLTHLAHAIWSRVCIY